jgi:hypothetical protein
MEKIINEEALLEDTAEGLADRLDTDIVQASAWITDDDMEWIMEMMFCAQSDCIAELAERIKNDKT